MAEAGDTCAVSVTDCPTTDGLSEEVNVTLVANLETVCVSGADVLGASVESPL